MTCQVFCRRVLVVLLNSTIKCQRFCSDRCIIGFHVRLLSLSFCQCWRIHNVSCSTGSVRSLLFHDTQVCLTGVCQSSCNHFRLHRLFCSLLSHTLQQCYNNSVSGSPWRHGVSVLSPSQKHCHCHGDAPLKPDGTLQSCLLALTMAIQ